MLASALIAGLMISCKEESSSKPTAPSIPLYPEGQTSENSNQMGFYSSKGDGQFGAYAGTSNEFQISVPAGDYVLEYTTQSPVTNSMQSPLIGGPYHIVFRATQPSILFIGLIHSTVNSASVQSGTIINYSVSTPWVSNSVTLVSWPGGGISSWEQTIQINTSSMKITLIQNGAVVPGIVQLPKPQQPATPPAPRPAPEPQTGMPTATPKPSVTPTVTQTPAQIEKVMLPGPYHDAEKLTSEDGMYMCWAAAPANALMWGGWATGFSNAQDVFRKFQEYWRNYWNYGGPGPKDTIGWWFNGDNVLSATMKTNYLDKTDGGNYWPGESPSNYYSEGSFSLDSVNSSIRNQYAVMITATKGNGEHWINVWGFEKDPGKPNEEYLYITDNQDGDANNPTPKRITVKQEGGVWRLYEYVYSSQTGWYIGQMAALRKK